VVNDQVYGVASALPARSVTPETVIACTVPNASAADGVNVTARSPLAATVPATVVVPAFSTTDPVVLRIGSLNVTVTGPAVATLVAPAAGDTEATVGRTVSAVVNDQV
jgi:hypothetical protein